MNDTDQAVITAYQMQRILGLRLKCALQEIAEEKLPDDIEALLRKIDELSKGKQPRNPAH